MVNIMPVANVNIGGMGSAVGTGRTSLNPSENVLSKRGMMAAVTLPITDVLGGIAKGIGKLAQWSPMFNAELIRMRKGMQLIFMPIADTMANFLRPFAETWLNAAAKFYEDYKAGNLWDGLKGFFGSIGESWDWVDEAGKLSLIGVITNFDELTDSLAGIGITVATFLAGVGLLKGLWGLFAGVGLSGAFLLAGKIALPAVIYFAGKEALQFAGYEGWQAALIAGFAAAGFVVMMAAGVGLALSLPIVLTFGGIMIGLEAVTDQLAREFGMAEYPLSDILDIEGGKEAINDFMMTDINKGQGTIGMQLNEFTGKFELLPATSKQISEQMKFELEQGKPFNPLITDMITVQNETDNEIIKIQELNTEVTSLPDIYRTITYHVKYVYG